MTERRYTDLALAGALVAAGATLVRTEPGRRVAFVLAPPPAGPDLAELERRHFSGVLMVSSRALNEARFSFGHLVKLARAGDDAPQEAS